MNLAQPRRSEPTTVRDKTRRVITKGHRTIRKSSCKMTHSLPIIPKKEPAHLRGPENLWERASGLTEDWYKVW